MREGGYDLGLAFDGDADRCLAADERGALIDGDQIMAVCGLALKREQRLPGDTVVATVMSNLGLHVFAREHGMTLVCTDVGDRNVLERMKLEGFSLGGEQSGHMIFSAYSTTGDGQLTALQLMRVLRQSGLRASELADCCKRFPQVLVNIPVADGAAKEAVMTSPLLWQAVASEEGALGDGRILVRPSGTEALIRVMVEAAEIQQAGDCARRLADLVKKL
ncbi:Phosphoglucosamine mutase [bioreactor metagenome]|uniref:Phosphoglucosamine mutase n=1 Tax=bioreactor metagenome TaxID=1076179 RepID=A0A644Z3T0_9ZZZZ